MNSKFRTTSGRIVWGRRTPITAYLFSFYFLCASVRREKIYSTWTMHTFPTSMAIYAIVDCNHTTSSSSMNNGQRVDPFQRSCQCLDQPWWNQHLSLQREPEPSVAVTYAESAKHDVMQTRRGHAVLAKRLG